MNHIIYSTFLLVLWCTLAHSLFFSQILAEEIEPVNVSKSTGKSDLAQLAVLGDDVYIVWVDKSTGNNDIYFSKSSDGGIRFNDPVNLSDNEGLSAFPRLAVAGEKIYTVWYDYTPGQSDIFYSKSFDDGNSFETINLSDNEGVSYNPWVAAFENNVYVVWNDETPAFKKLNISKPANVDVALAPLDILLATSHDGGSSFFVSNLSESQFYSSNPRITVYQNYVYVVWNEKLESNDEIFFVVSEDNGKSFSQPINLSSSDGGSKDAGIAVSGNYVYVIWQESSAGSRDIFFVVSSNNGISFSDTAKVSNDGLAELTRDTQIVVFENNVYVVWFDKSASGGVFFVRSEDNGRTFSKPINLSGQAPQIGMAQIAVNEDNVYVIWHDSRLGNSEVFLRKSNDKGLNFGSIINLSKEGSESNLFILGPQIAATNQKVYTIYEKINEHKSDLFLNVIEKEPLQNGTMVLESINGAIKVEMGFDMEKIEAGQPVTISLKFLNGSSSQLARHISYSLTIKDSSGNEILSNLNEYTESGYDNTTVIFPQTGPKIITISVEEMALDSFENESYSSTVSGIVTVVPEFPLGAMFVIIVVISFFVILTRLRYYPLTTNY